MKRQLNIRLLAGLLLGLVVGAGLVHLLHGYLIQRSARTLLRRADQVGAAGQPSEELDLLKRYLVYRPEDVEALERSGFILARAGTPAVRGEALAIFEKVLLREPDRVKARREAAELAHDLGQIDAARAHYEFLARTAPAGDAEVEAALGRCEEEIKRYPEAVAWYEKALEHDPRQVGTYTRIAQLCRTVWKDADRADRLMDAREIKDGVVARNPRSAQAYLDRAAYRRSFGLTGSREDVQQALALAPDDPNALLAAAEDAPTEEAIRLLGRGIALAPDDERCYERIARRELGAGQRRAAIDHLKAGVGRLPKNANLLWLLTEVQIDDGDEAGAADGIKRLRASKLPGVTVDFLDCRVLVGARRWTKAARELNRIAPALAAMPSAVGLTKRAFLLLARCQAQLGNAELRSSAARRALALDVADPALNLAARTELAFALVALGRIDEAADEFRMAIALPNSAPELRLDLCRVLVAKTLRLPAEQRRWEEVDQALNEPSGRPPESDGLAILRAEVLIAQGRIEPARDRLRAAEKMYPQSAALVVARAALMWRQGQPREALALVEAAQQRLGDRPELLTALIGFWGGTPGPDAAGKLRDLVPKVSRIGNPTERTAVLETLAASLERGGERGAAQDIREGLIAEQPDHLGIQLAQFEAAFRGSDFGTASRALDEIQRIEGPDGVIWRYGRAQLLIATARQSPDPAQLDQASSLLAEARERRPGWTQAITAAAEVDDLRGDAPAALRAYLAAIEKGERDPRVLRRAVEMLNRLGRYAQANTLLAQAQKDSPLTPELGRLAADVALRVQDDGRAIELARRTSNGPSPSAADQTWLGQLLLAAARQAEVQQRPEEARTRRLEAEQAFRRGIELAPNDPDARIGLIVALAAWGRLDDAREALRAAEGSLQGPTGDLALARGYEAVGLTDQADAKYRRLLVASPDDPAALRAAATAALRASKVTEAEPLLRRLIGLRGRYPGEAAWAKRALALALATSGPGGSLKARELLGLADVGPAGTAASGGQADLEADDRRGRAQILARQPGRAARRQAIAILELMATRDEARPADTLLRAQLLASDGDWKRARALGLQLLSEDRSNPAILVFLARGQIATTSPDEANPWIDELVRLNVAPALVNELRARMLFASGKAPEAVSLLVALARHDPQLGSRVAGLLEDARQGDAAESLLRSLDPSALPPPVRVDQSLALAALLGRKGRHAEAITICERLWSDPGVPPSRVSPVALGVLYTGHPEGAVVRRVQTHIEAALRRKPDDLVLQFDQANLLILRGQYGESEAIFRAIHRRQPLLGAALNNLAWLLAFRGGGNQPLELIDRAIAIDGPTPDLLDTRGVVLTRKGQPEQAIDDLEEAVATAPAPLNYLHLALAFQKAGRVTEAGEAWAKAHSLGLKSSDVHPLERPGYDELGAAFPNR